MPVIGVAQHRAADDSGNAGRVCRVSSRTAAKLGWVEGRNVAIEYRWADGQCDRLSHAGGRTWSPARSTSSSRLAARPWRSLPSRRPAPSRSSSRSAADPVGSGLSQAWRGRAATSPASLLSSTAWRKVAGDAQRDRAAARRVAVLRQSDSPIRAIASSKRHCRGVRARSSASQICTVERQRRSTRSSGLRDHSRACRAAA